MGEAAEGSRTHSNVTFVHEALWPCTWRSDVQLRGHGCEVDLLIAVSNFACHFLDHNFLDLSIFHFRWLIQDVQTTQLTVFDVSAPTTMKGAAKCDKHCELQDSVNQ